MAKYAGVKCPVCGRRFTQGDDIVVCPVCGAPHHRACYADLGECARASEHISGGEWQPESPPESERNRTGEEPDNAEGTRLCPACGAANPVTSLFCQICGRHMLSPRAPSPGGQGCYPFGDPFGGVDKNETLGGLPVSDVMYYVGQGSAYYIPRFHSFEKRGSKIAFNISAFLFHFLYYFYRKMYLIGALLLLVFAAGLVPQFLLAKEYAPELLHAMGLGPEAIINEDAVALYSSLSNIAMWIGVCIRAALGCTATRVYYGKVLREASALIARERPEGEDYHPELMAGGGVDRLSVSMLVAVVTVAFFFASGAIMPAV